MENWEKFEVNQLNQNCFLKLERKCENISIDESSYLSGAQINLS